MLAGHSVSAAEFARRVKLHHGTLTTIQKRPPTKLPKKVDLELWAQVLKLSPEERGRLVHAAELAWSPAGIQQLVRRLKRR